MDNVIQILIRTASFGAFEAYCFRLYAAFMSYLVMHFHVWIANHPSSNSKLSSRLGFSEINLRSTVRTKTTGAYKKAFCYVIL